MNKTVISKKNIKIGLLTLIIAMIITLSGEIVLEKYQISSLPIEFASTAISSVKMPKSNFKIYQTTAIIAVGDTFNIKIAKVPSNTKKITWRVENKNATVVGKVDQNGEKYGVVTGKKLGTVEVVAIAKNSQGNVIATASCYVTVASIKVPKKVEVNISDKKYNLKKTTEISTNAITPQWESSDHTIATVNANGVVTLKKQGTVRITAKAGTISDTSTLVIKSAIKNNEIQISPKKVTEKLIKLGETVKVSASDMGRGTVNWKSSNDKIATVNQVGKVTVKRTGAVEIIATCGTNVAKAKLKISGSRIHFLHVKYESGDAILLESNGLFALVDAGDYPTSTGEKTGLEKYLDKLGVTNLEFMIISHNHLDHNNRAAAILKQYPTKVLYMKSYDKDKDRDGTDASQKKYDGIVTTATSQKTTIIYVDEENSGFRDAPGKSGVITLGNSGFYSSQNMAIHLFNTIQRNLTKGYNKNNFDYYESQNFVGNGENLNSIVSWVRVNNHSALLNGDLNNSQILKGIFANKIKDKKIDVYEYPHHANFNCTGNSEFFVDADYYIATTSLEIQFSRKDPNDSNNLIYSDYKIEPGFINHPEQGKLKSCFYYSSKGKLNKEFERASEEYYESAVQTDAKKANLHAAINALESQNTIIRNAKNMMCQTYYGNDTADAVVVDLTEDYIKIQGKQGYDIGNRCK